MIGKDKVKEIIETLENGNYKELQVIGEVCFHNIAERYEELQFRE